MPYRWVFEEQALASLLALRQRQRRSVLSAVEHLAVHPFHSGHLHYRDLREREVRVWLVEDVEIHYTLDHAVREVRVVDVQREE